VETFKRWQSANDARWEVTAKEGGQGIVGNASKKLVPDNRAR